MRKRDLSYNYAAVHNEWRIYIMASENFEQYFKLGRTFLTPWNDIGKAWVDIFRKTSQDSLEIASTSLARYSEQLQRLSNVNRPEELFNIEKECFNENLNASMNNLQKFINNSLENFAMINKTFTTAKEQATSTRGSAGSTDRNK